jgi:hypothetical protein
MRAQASDGRRLRGRGDEAVGVFGSLGVLERQLPGPGDGVGDLSAGPPQAARVHGAPGADDDDVGSLVADVDHGDRAGLARGRQRRHPLDQADGGATTRQEATRGHADGLRAGDELLGPVLAHGVGQHPHALGRGSDAATHHAVARHRRRHGGRQWLEGVHHVLEVDRDDRLQLGPDRLVEVTAPEVLEGELEHVGVDLAAKHAQVAGVVLEAVFAHQLAHHGPGPCLGGLGARRDQALDHVGDLGAAQAGLGDGQLDAPGAEIEGVDAAHRGQSSRR